MSVFAIDKGAALRTALDRLGVRHKDKQGWQQIHCPNQDGHPTGDKHPSCSVHLGAGKIHCFACGLAGDVFDMMQEINGDSAKEVLAWLELKPGDVVARLEEKNPWAIDW